jgi:E3 ubiquitin-protein ligase UBR7
LFPRIVLGSHTPFQDWFHESCLHLRDPPSEEDTTAEDDDASDTSSLGLPPPLIAAEDYDAFVCRECVLSIPILRRWAGTPGVLMVIRNSVNDPWEIHGLIDNEEAVDISAIEEQVTIETGRKRARSPPLQTEPAAKRPRACLAPSPNPAAQSLYSTDSELGAGDIFLTDGWRDRWCKCSDVRPSRSP